VGRTRNLLVWSEQGKLSTRSGDPFTFKKARLILQRRNRLPHDKIKQRHRPFDIDPLSVFFASLDTMVNWQSPLVRTTARYLASPLWRRRGGAQLRPNRDSNLQNLRQRILSVRSTQPSNVCSLQLRLFNRTLHSIPTPASMNTFLLSRNAQMPFSRFRFQFCILSLLPYLTHE
jgi:hypothetical protein